ncbi:MAG TPA: DUF6799 domain-containing protein [Cytophagaceae bacterium]|jgi:hypothetical protein
MKDYLKLVLVSLFISNAVGSYAQDAGAIDFRTVKEGVVMRDGKMMKISKAGTLDPLEEDLTLSDAVVSKTGEVKYTNGGKLRLKNGEVLTKNGKLMMLEDQVQNVEGVAVRDGKLILIKDGGVTLVDNDTYLNNDGKISGEGIVEYKSGFKYKIKEGEIVTLDGQIMRRKDDQMDADGIIMRGGKVLRYDKGKPVVADKDFTMANGAKVSPDGTVLTKDGMKINLREGDVLNSKGDIGFSKSELVTEGVTKREGKIYKLDNGRFKPMTSEQVLGNGSIVQPTGIIISKDSSKLLMKDGDLVTLKGEYFVGRGAKLDAKMAENRGLNDHLIFRDGRVMIVKNGEPELLLKDLVMPNGAKIFKHGHVHTKEGNKLVMKPGQKMDMNGDLIADKAKIEFDQKNYIVFKGGKAMQVTDGRQNPVFKEIVLSESTKVLADGTIDRGGKKTKMKEGEKLSMEGEALK